jgi:membrane-bound ClpP family serine protease
LIFLAFIALSFFASGSLYGLPGKLPWSIYLWGTDRHPLQLYYLVLFLLSAGFIVQEIKTGYPQGTIFFFGLTSISLIVLFLEAFRGSPSAMIGIVRIPQVVAFILLIISIRNIKLTNTTSKIDTNPLNTRS